MTTVVHRGTEIKADFDIVDDQGNIVDSESTTLKLSTLTSEDFETALKGLLEVKDSLRTEYDAHSESRLAALSNSLQGIVVELMRINERLGKLEKCEEKIEENKEEAKIDDLTPVEEKEPTISSQSLSHRPPPETKTRMMARKAREDREARKLRAQARRNCS